MEKIEIGKGAEAWAQSVLLALQTEQDPMIKQALEDCLYAFEEMMAIFDELTYPPAKMAILLAAKCLASGPETTMGVGTILDAMINGKAVLIAEPQMMGPAVGTA